MGGQGEDLSVGKRAVSDARGCEPSVGEEGMGGERWIGEAEAGAETERDWDTAGSELIEERIADLTFLIFASTPKLSGSISVVQPFSQCALTTILRGRWGRYRWSWAPYRRNRVYLGFRTGPPAGTRRPTRTRTRQYRTRPTRGFKPVRVSRGLLIYPRFPGKTADQHFVYAAYRNAAAIWHGTLFSRPHKAGTASAECRPRLPSTRGFTRAGPRYCGGSEISTRTRTRQTLGSKPANGPDTRAEPYVYCAFLCNAFLSSCELLAIFLVAQQMYHVQM
ncbi:hypothetical protein DFH09DRAFT_1090046 [Mycena vulgaris]|nr:hypothetical protein DFH09DRAFT_1090046 [Mycena vulgaris]